MSKNETMWSPLLYYICYKTNIVDILDIIVIGLNSKFV